MKLFENLVPAVFLSRPNRFVVRCRTGGKTVSAYLPNPGRLWELLLPGADLLLTALPPAPGRKLRWLAVAVQRGGMPVMLHTHHNNLVARRLIETGRVPGIEGAKIVRPEHRVGNSRFDFLLRRNGRDILLEVKSCTLFHDRLAMFPDAVSARATKHLLELESLAREGYRCAVLFIVHSPRARFFMPEHHTDLDFCRALLQVRDRVLVKAVSVGWTGDLVLEADARELTIPWDLVERESHDRGSSLTVLRMDRDRTIPIEGLGKVRFRKGFYIYVESSGRDLAKRIAAHRRPARKKTAHIDYLRAETTFIAGIPVRSAFDRTCEAAASVGAIAGWSVPGFGSDRCRCESHLFGMDGDPLHSRRFIDTLLDLRMGTLEEELRRSHVPSKGADGPRGTGA